MLHFFFGDALLCLYFLTAIPDKVPIVTNIGYLLLLFS
jgi:hypothetical protein